MGRRTAELLIAEIGTDTGRFPSQHTWPPGRGCAPHEESAGKRRSGKTRRGCPWPR